MKVTRNLSLLGALLIVGAAFVSCDKDLDIKDSDSGKTYKYSVNVKTSIGESPITKGILTLGTDSEDNNIIDFTWDNDVIYVYKTASDGTYGSDDLLGQLSPINISGNTADFTGKLTFKTEPQEGDYIYLSNIPFEQLPTYEDGQIGTLADIAQKYDFFGASVSIQSISSEGKIQLSDAAFLNNQAILKLSLFERLADGTSGEAINPTALQITYDTETYDINVGDETFAVNGDGVVYVAVWGKYYNDNKFSIYAEEGDAKYQLVAPGEIEIIEGKFYEITANMPRYWELSESKSASFVDYVVTTDAKVLLNKNHSDAAGKTIGAVIAHADGTTNAAVAIHDASETASHGEEAEGIAEAYTAVTGVSWRLANHTEFQTIFGNNVSTLNSYILAADGSTLLGNDYSMVDNFNKNKYYYAKIADDGAVTIDNNNRDHKVRPIFTY